MPKRTIIFVSDAVYPFSKGGKEKRLYDISQLLIQRGYAVSVYTMKWWQGPDSITLDGVHFRALCRNYHLYVGRRRSIKQGFLFGLACLRLVKVQFDVIDVDEIPFFPLYSVWIICVLRRKKMIATWHEVWGKEYWRQYLGWKGVIASAVEALAVKLPSRIVAVSDLTAQQLETVLLRKKGISIVNNGINVSKIATIIPAHDHHDIIFAARLLSHKHADLLIEAVGDLKKKYPKISCLIIGTGPEEVYLKQLASDLAVTSNVHFRDFYEDINELYAHIKSTKVYVLPSDREGFGLGVLEANACGTPAVTTDDPNNAARLLIKKNRNGSVVAPNADSLSLAIQYWLKHDSKQISNTVSEYDWKHSMPKLLEVYSR